MKKFDECYYNIITVENLLCAWKEFLSGKKKKNDIAVFQNRLMDNILSIYRDLKEKRYIHGSYSAFKIFDPKPRDIHKATVRDRIVHHLLYQKLYGYFDGKLIHDSYSCRIGKGTHKALNRFHDFGRIVSKNNMRTCWVLKCDIKKFFASVNQKILREILSRYIKDDDLLNLVIHIIGSFYTEGKHGIGLPLGNLTSQLLVNVYMNEFDHFVKRELKARHYVRYADDFVFMHENKEYLENLIPRVSDFLEDHLKLTLHPKKIFIKTLFSGVDFLGWIHFPSHRILRRSTRRRMFKKIAKNKKIETLNSYMGFLKHGNAYKVREQVLDVYL